MAAAEEHLARIPPGDILRLFEELGIRSSERDGIKAAQVQFANYVSNRSVALISRPCGGMYVGSGVCFRIGNRSFVATAKHNLEHEGQALKISDLEIRARGEKQGPPLKVQSIGLATNRDLAWLEIDPDVSMHPHLAFVTIDETATLPGDEGQQACFLLGYPAETAEKPSTVQERPVLESICVGTLSIEPSARQGPPDLDTFAIEWPPHDGSLKDYLPEPHGVSGGGVWLLPRHDSYSVWSPERSRLIGIETAWWRDHRELVVVRIECWLELVANQIPELRDKVATILQTIRSRGA